MSILLDGASVIVPVAVLEQKYPGGWRGFAAEFGNGSFRQDEQIAAVSFLDRADAACVAAQLVDADLDLGEVCAGEFCVVDNGGMLWKHCLWLDLDENADGLLIASYSGVEQETIAVPGYFNPDDPTASLGSLYRLNSRQLKRRLEIRGSDGDGVLLRDRKTGNTMKAGFPIHRH